MRVKKVDEGAHLREMADLIEGNDQPVLQNAPRSWFHRMRCATGFIGYAHAHNALNAHIRSMRLPVTFSNWGNCHLFFIDSDWLLSLLLLLLLSSSSLSLSPQSVLPLFNCWPFCFRFRRREMTDWRMNGQGHRGRGCSGGWVGNTVDHARSKPNAG